MALTQEQVIFPKNARRVPAEAPVRIFLLEQFLSGMPRTIAITFGQIIDRHFLEDALLSSDLSSDMNFTSSVDIDRVATTDKVELLCRYWISAFASQL